MAPDIIITRTSEEFFAVCDRVKRGEIQVQYIDVLPRGGGYRVVLQPPKRQLELIDTPPYARPRSQRQSEPTPAPADPDQRRP